MAVSTTYQGPELELTEDDPLSVVEALTRAARTRPDAGVVVVGTAGQSELLTYPHILDRARRILSGLRAQGVGQGDSVLLCGLPLVDFFPAFWACLLGGVRPVVIAEPADEGSPAAERSRHTWTSLGGPVVLADPSTARRFTRAVTVAECARHEPAGEFAEARPDDVVLLMLSSGSTGMPKAIGLTQRALVRFAASSRRILDVRADDVTLNWLPLDHSGALLLYHLMTVFVGCTNVHVPTEVVLADPPRWLDLMAEHRANHSWAPTFAFQLIADAVADRRADRRPEWDLSALKTLVCGGEQILLPVLRRFLAALEPCGVVERHVVPVWGMAETTTAISYGRLDRPGTVLRVLTSSLDGRLAYADDSVPDRECTTFIAVGEPAHEASARVVDEHGSPLPEDRIGRLQIRSVRVTPGYLNDPEATAAAFVDGDWLDTGDLAFLTGGQIVITGRHKDVIILNGHNHFAHEIESVATTVPGVRIGDVAACGVPDERTGSESLAVFFVSTGADDTRIADEVKRVLYGRLRLTAAHVVPVTDFPRTSAGKVQRSKLRDRLLPGPRRDAGGLRQVLSDAVTEVAGQRIGDREPFYDAGLSSVTLVRLRRRLEDELGRPVPQTALFEHPTIDALARHLAGADSASVPKSAPDATPDTRIAVIGMAARFPGAPSVDQFWTNLRAGVDSTRTFSPAEATAAGVPAELIADPERVLAIGAIDDVDAFDAEYFGMTPREAESTHPAQRLFLQCCYHALENGGYATAADARIGVFAGSGMNLYGHQGMPATRSDDPAERMQAAIGREPDFLATRVAYRLGLTGPAIGVQTACSTALVAVHLAVQALLNDEADMALAGAAAVHLPQESGYRSSTGSILSPSGRCRPFDAQADGTVGGNGVASVLLKRLDRALADGDTIHAVILGSAVNNDGSGKAGFTAPGVAGQVDVVQRALRRAGVPGDSISYVEAHGTGTELGDPIEFTALSRAVGADTDRRGFCTLGSVKGNIGHLDSCAGMAGLIKTVLMVKHGELVPTLNLDQPNPQLRLADSPFVLGTALRKWTTDGLPRRAGVSALGVGGTNAHVVLEEPPMPEAPKTFGPVIVPLSARDPQALATLAERVRAHCAAQPSLNVADAAVSMALGRPHLPYRAAVVGSDPAELASRLDAVVGSAEPLRALVFAFPGQGVARYGMARDLYSEFPVVRQVLDECEQVYAAEFGTGLLRLLVDADPQPGEVWPTETAQPALFAFQVALGRLWESFGTRPDLVTGHSLGEYAALCVAGAMSVADGVRLTGTRGRLASRCAAGGMLAVWADAAVVERIGRASGTEVAAVNGPLAHVLAGSLENVRRAEQLLGEEGLKGRRLPVDGAFHTALLEPVLPEFREHVPSLWPLKVPFAGSLDGQVRPVGWRPDAEYLVRQAREPVRFDLVLAAVADHTCLEIGPGEVLTDAGGHGWLAGLRVDRPAVVAVLEALGELYVRGADVSWPDVVRGGRRVPMPEYPFARTRFPVTPKVERPKEPVASDALDAVRGATAEVLGLRLDAVPPDGSFFALGADSLALMSLSRVLDQRFGVSVPMRTLITEADTPRKLAALVKPAATPQPVQTPVSAPDDVQDLVGRQLHLSERLVDLMERQLALLSAPGVTPPVPRTRVQQPAPLAEPVLAEPVLAEPVLAEPVLAAGPATSCDFSLYFFGDYPEQHETDKYALINAATEFADRHDFHAVWLPERHFHSFGALFPSPSVLAAWLAARTKQIRLHAGSVVLPLHNPIRVAEEWSVIDNLSNGRVGLCVASGWHARDFALAPENYGQHKELVHTQLDTVRRLWAGEAITTKSGNGDEVDVRLYPRPIQSSPPLFLAVVGNPESYRRAAAQDLGVVTNLMTQTVDQLAANIALYRRTRAESGLDPAAGRVVVLVHTYLGADAERARAEAFRPFCDYLRSTLSLFDQVTNSLGFDIDLENTPPDDVDFLLERAYERYCASRALIGSEQTAAAVVDQLVAAGVNEIACFVDFGVPTDDVLAALPAVDRLRVRYRSRPLPLSPAQRRIWFLEKMYPDSSAYHEPKAIRFDGPLDVDALTGALGRAVNRHPELRVVFQELDGEPHRVVLPEIDVDCPVLDFTGYDEQDALRSVLGTEGKRVFSLAEGPLILARLLRLGPDRHLLFLLVHHIVFDSSSSAVLVDDLAAYYRAWPAQPVGLPPVAVRAPVEADPAVKERDLAFWRRELADLPVLNLPTDRPRGDVRTGAGASITREFGPDLLRDLRSFGAEHRTTAFMSLLSAIGVVLGRFTGQQDVVVGTAVANRPPGAEREVGLFLDTVAVRLDLSGDPAFTTLLHRVRERTTAAYEHRDVPFDELVRALNPERDAGRNPLFQVMVEFEQEGEVEFDPPALSARLLDVPSDRAPFDLTVYLTQHREGVRCMIEYDTALFDGCSVERMLDYVDLVLRLALRAPASPLSGLTPLTEADRAAVGSWQGAPVDPPDVRLHELVSLQAQRTPDAVALLADGVEWRYREVEERANQIASRLRERGVGRGDVVAVVLPRGSELITAVLGVLKSGAAYLPLDPGLPPARVAFCVEDSSAALLLTTGRVPDWAGLPVQLVEDVGGEVSGSVPGGSPDDPAYCIYTSGSTGRPKGVLVPHRGPVNLVRWHLRRHAPLRTAQWTSLSFDVSVQEIFTTLAAGGTLVLVDEESRHDLAAVVAKYRVERLFLPFTPLKYLVETQPDLPSLREVNSAGEALVLTPALRQFLARHPECRLYNQYGPTEASVIVTSHRVDPEGEPRPPIGTPIDGVRLRVVDVAGRDVPVGVPGELVIGGLPVALGYVGQDSPAFAPDLDGARAYRTGDRVRWRSDGTVEFLGRFDQQVKIRGHRVEPGEAEFVLAGLDDVVDAAVVVRESRGEPELVAYVVPKRAGAAVDFQRDLERVLPDHLVPRQWVALDRLPYTVNGKLDHSRLPAPSGPVADEGEAPSTRAERLLHDSWRAELGVDAVSVTRSFFELGGHSLTALRLVNRMARDHGVEITMTEFFRTPTIRALARRLPAHEVVDTAPMPSSLRRLWQRHHERTDPSVYNVVQRVDIDGELDVAALTRAFREVVRRHAALRSRAVQRDGDLLVEVLDAVDVDLPVTTLTGGHEVERWCRAQADEPFSLQEAPLFRLGLGKLDGSRWVLVVVLNHAICDAWSLGILWRDLADLYAGSPALPPQAQYTDYARWEHRQLSGDGKASLERFWRSELADVPLRPALPVDRPRPARLSGRGGLHEFAIGREVADRVGRVAAELGTTPYTVLVSAYAVWLAARCGQPDVVVPASSVNRLRPEHEEVFGFIGDAVLLHAKVSAAADFAELVAQMGSTIYRALDHQALPLTEVARLLDPNTADTLFPTTLFTVVTTQPPTFALPNATAVVHLPAREGLARNELYVVLMPSDDGIRVAMEYSTDLFDEATVVSLGATFAETLATFTDNPRRSLRH
ncbi:natural product biosynthesis luciferase-like monooxygenase protein/amino acid adenylation domain-containing protein [Saccharothrix ecbatanensis]|uniref:Natural product biosynthesis luciferase-like monooxygenase protein/amino acid adenylation domain-containing protein n=1 Tax=Saccharothrix ecbatanensis TaxID=1105145 RepID=A0A7W9HK16_9PSEU|nr:non-ribosomal peptide synthetase/type I polyketide synthase [Saccharothrix ecbatanensis]MBB5803733.1 natural product biosynthesis luciferase-like monooxygenase protein/amino acid adenylation domain-containing protein [Saccharothrix ecbatanensis]